MKTLATLAALATATAFCCAAAHKRIRCFPGFIVTAPRRSTPDRCIQIFGGLGVSKELPLERWYRELRIKRIGEGPSEVQRMVVARNLLGNRG